jgi:hypothetical protein
MILWQMRRLNGKNLWDGRHIKVRRSDKCARAYLNLRKKMRVNQ